MIPRVISMLLLGQLLVIFFGVMIVASGLRLFEIGQPDYYHSLLKSGELLPFPFYVRKYGYWLSLLPLGWAVAAIRNARAAAENKNPGQRYELAGWLLFGALLLFFLVVCCGLIGWLIFIVLMAIFYYFLWRLA
jgi:hypothetical protein